MKLTVLTWFRDFILQVLAKTIEITFRLILFFMPLGVYMIIMQLRSKVSSITSLTVYTKDNSVWQHVFPGFILVSIDPNETTNRINRVRTGFLAFIDKYRNVIITLGFTIVIALAALAVWEIYNI